MPNRVDPTGARPCHITRATVHRRTAGRALVVPVFAVSARGARPCTPVARPCAPCFPLFCNSWCRGFLKPLIFLEIAREEFFSIET